jgi:hypothetical protein
MVTLEAAYLSEDLEFWYSDRTAGFGNNGYIVDPKATAPFMLEPGQNPWSGTYYLQHGFFDDRFTFTGVDGHTYFRTNLAFSGFDIGIMIPTLFGNGLNQTTGTESRDVQAGKNLFIDDVMKKTVFGAKLNMYPIEFAAQFKFEDYGVYFGGKFFLGPVAIGASFMGILAPETGSAAEKRMKVGGSVAYDAGQMGVGIKAYLDRNDGLNVKSSVEGHTQVIAIQPNFFFKIIPSHLGFKLDTGFYFTKEVFGKTEESEVYWAIQPQLFWNFNGTGAWTGYPWGSAAGASTGMFVRYRMISNTASFLDVVFSWSL